MNIFVIILDLVGTIAFSVSGAMVAIKKNMDIFGVMILGLITAVGGGVIRDLTLGISPCHLSGSHLCYNGTAHSCHRVSSSRAAAAGPASAYL